MKGTPMETTTIRVVKRDYWKGDHRPYTNVMHTDADRDDGIDSKGDKTPFLKDALLDGFPDGALVEITARVIGQMPGKWVHTKPHTYERIDA